MKKILLILGLILLLSNLSFHYNATACTGIRLDATDTGIVVGRTMEWGSFFLNTKICIFPKEYVFHSLTSDSIIEGKPFTSKYGFIGLEADTFRNVLPGEYILDGMNEHGLAVGSFFCSCSIYQDLDSSNYKNSISVLDVSTYILSQCTTVAETDSLMKEINVTSHFKIHQLGIDLKFHWMVTDTTGHSIIIEYQKGKLVLNDTTLGVITNEPFYDWHLTNLGNYLNIPNVLAPSAKWFKGAPDSISIRKNGSGSQMFGIPGDNTPTSRFIRAVAWVQTARPCVSASDAVNEVFRILDNFQLPTHDGEGSDALDVYCEGSKIEIKTKGGYSVNPKTENDLQLEFFSNKKTDDSITMHSDTQWTTAWNLTDRTLCYHTQFNRRVRLVDFNDINFKSDSILRIPLDNIMLQDIDTLKIPFPFGRN